MEQVKMIGQTVSHYKILEKLGEGGMGIIYKAEDTKLKRTVALKFLPTALTSRPTAKERFMVEARAAAALNHLHIVTVHEINEYEQQLYIVMEYVQGETLKEKIDSGLLAIDEALQLAIQTAEGLGEAHEKNIVHRDIKSDNIMIDEKGQVKIMDFGLAKLKGQAQLTRKGTTLGTAPYMSPEQTRGSGVDHRTDIWSLGVVMYEMFSGQLPFKGDYPQAIYYSIMNEDPEPLSRLRTGIPAELERIINKALAKKTTKRYQQIADLLRDLRKLTEDSKTKIAPIKTKTRPEFTIRVSPISMILGIILLAALIIAAWFFLYKGKFPATIPITPVNEALTRPSLAVVYFENNSGDPNLDNWRSAFSELLATDLSQSKYIRVLRSDQIYSIFKKLNLLEAEKYSTEDLKEIAKKARVNRILKGSYIKAGDNFVITAMLINADTGETISSLSVKAKGEKNIFTKVDDLTKKVKLELNLTSDQIAADIDSNVGEITTASPESYMHYVQGITFFNELQYRKAIQSLEKAIEIDPGFAMAYRKISRAYGNLGYDVSEAGYLKRAFALRNRVSERERLLIQADFYRESEKTIEKAMESFEQLFQLYPDDLVGNNALALLYEDFEEWDKAIEQFKICINNDDPFIGPYEGISRMYMNKGLTNKAREVLENNINIVSNKAVVHRCLAWLYITLGEYDRALVEVGKSSSLDPSHYQNTRYLGDIYFCQGEPEKAAKEYRKLLQYKEGGAFYYHTVRMAALDAMQGKLISQKSLIENLIKKAKEVKVKWADRTARYVLADIYRKSGNPGLALKEYDRIWQSAFEDGKVEDQRKSLWNKGLTYLEMGSIEKARETADQLRSLIETGVNPKKIRYYYHLLAVIFLEEKEFTQAVDYFNKALSRLPQYWELRIVILYSLGNMFLHKGDIEKARETFETIISSKGMTRIHNSALISMSIYTLGKIYQEKGWKGKAIENYNKFIELWKACDPQFQPLVEDARKRVNRLEKEN